MSGIEQPRGLVSLLGRLMLQSRIRGWLKWLRYTRMKKAILPLQCWWRMMRAIWAKCALQRTRVSDTSQPCIPQDPSHLTQCSLCVGPVGVIGCPAKCAVVCSPSKHAGMVGGHHSDSTRVSAIFGQDSGAFWPSFFSLAACSVLVPDTCSNILLFRGPSGVHVGTLPLLCSSGA
jgi:hypothetical protein